MKYDKYDVGFFVGSMLILATALTVHELGHFIAFRANNVPIQTFSIGLPIPYVPRAQFTSERFPGTIFQITPILVMAYVAPTGEGVKITEKLPWKEQMLINSAGILITSFFACVLLLAKVLLEGFKVTWNLVACILVLVIIPAAPYVVASFFIPPFGLSVMGYMFYQWLKPEDTEQGHKPRSGRLLSQLPWPFGYALNILVVLTVFNALPLGILDGARIWGLWFKHLMPGWYDTYLNVNKVLCWAILLAFLWLSIRHRQYLRRNKLQSRY